MELVIIRVYTQSMYVRKCFSWVQIPENWVRKPQVPVGFEGTLL